MTTIVKLTESEVVEAIKAYIKTKHEGEPKIEFITETKEVSHWRDNTKYQTTIKGVNCIFEDK